MCQCRLRRHRYSQRRLPAARAPPAASNVRLRRCAPPSSVPVRIGPRARRSDRVSDRLRRHRAFGATATLVHELVEFGFVLGMPQPVEKGHEFALFLFEPTQGFGAILVESAIAGRCLPARPTPAPPALGYLLHPLHAPLLALHAPLPTRSRTVSPACHPPTPYQIAEHHQSERPPHKKAQKRQDDPCRFADLVQAL